MQVVRTSHTSSDLVAYAHRLRVIATLDVSHVLCILEVAQDPMAPEPKVNEKNEKESMNIRDEV